jgi:hypothetical protein
MKQVLFIISLIFFTNYIIASPIYNVNTKNGVHFIKHLIEPGDDINKIASTFHIDKERLSVFNNLSANYDLSRIHIILIPLIETNFFKSTGITRNSKKFSPVFVDAEKESNIVKICEKYSIEISAFYNWNKIDFAEKKIYEDAIIGWLKNDINLNQEPNSNLIASNINNKKVPEKTIDDTNTQDVKVAKVKEIVEIKEVKEIKVVENIDPLKSNITKVAIKTEKVSTPPLNEKVSNFFKKNFTTKKQNETKNTTVAVVEKKPIVEVSKISKLEEPAIEIKEQPVAKIDIKKPTIIVSATPNLTLKEKINKLLKPSYKEPAVLVKKTTPMLTSPVVTKPLVAEPIVNKTINTTVAKKTTTPTVQTDNKLALSLKKTWNKIKKNTNDLFQSKPKVKATNTEKITTDTKPVVVNQEPKVKLEEPITTVTTPVVKSTQSKKVTKPNTLLTEWEKLSTSITKTFKPKKEIKATKIVANNTSEKATKTVQVSKLETEDRFIKKGDDLTNYVEKRIDPMPVKTGVAKKIKANTSPINTEIKSTNKETSKVVFKETPKENNFETKKLKNKEIRKVVYNETKKEEVVNAIAKVENNEAINELNEEVTNNEITIIPPYKEPAITYTTNDKVIPNVKSTVNKSNGVTSSNIQKISFSNTKKGKASFFYSGTTTATFYVFTDMAEKGQVVKITNNENSKYIMAEVIGKLPLADLNSGILIKLSDNAMMPLKSKSQSFSTKIDY